MPEINVLQEGGLTIRVEEYANRVPRSQRGGEIIEPIVSEQWFVRMEPLAKPALEAVADGRIKIMPEVRTPTSVLGGGGRRANLERRDVLRQGSGCLGV